ncbi:PepSY domain-containing protein [Legionella israelensis]|uniref:PepSY domain-containing protein n=1 Tax=Legionella israelensis TaxID=454 RepID=UPI00117CE5AA|nr:PepSY domain-containing protein [Legionella israelensis]QDP73246.1 PepSY domain-containing protein [Legionella israelensis]
MKRKIFTGLIFIGLHCMLSSTTWGETNQNTSSLKMSDILQSLYNKGYKNIHDIEKENGIIKAEGINEQGIRYELHLNSRTGEIIKQKQNMQLPLSALDIAKEVETQGYFDITEIEFDESRYKVKALDKSHKEVELQINPDTGKIERNQEQ